MASINGLIHKNAPVDLSCLEGQTKDHKRIEMGIMSQAAFRPKCDFEEEHKRISSSVKGLREP